MKKVILIGDSIRMGYDKYVKEALDGVAEVWYPDDNCQYAENVLRFVYEWIEKSGFGADVDLIHWNAGLWDCLELFGDEPLTTIDYYKNAIGRIYKRIRMVCPNAKIVFATSTSVNEAMARPEFFRHNSVIKEYNEAAVEVLSGTDTVINDLWSLSCAFPDSYHSDSVHYYTPEGTEHLGGKVLSVICRELGIAAKDINIKNFEPEKYSKENIGF
ncbi:MAG: SGNH/GDSL hydrolase family protein [Clostridia bacterium]|nr:SGNH/GDSL hydrolase family protein [Clostridia bacterium]